jgi:hypothetical protein
MNFDLITRGWQQASYRLRDKTITTSQQQNKPFTELLALVSWDFVRIESGTR